MYIKDWYYNTDNKGVLYIYVIDEQDNELLASTIDDCENLDDIERDNLVKEILFDDLEYKEI